MWSGFWRFLERIHQIFGSFVWVWFVFSWKERDSAVNWQSGKFLPQFWRELIAFWIVERDSCFRESGTFDRQTLVWREVQSSGLSLKEWIEMSIIWFLMYFLKASWQLIYSCRSCPKRDTSISKLESGSRLFISLMALEISRTSLAAWFRVEIEIDVKAISWMREIQ